MSQRSDLPPSSSGCPSPDTIVAYLEGRAEPLVAQQILDHVDICSVCRLTVGNLLRADEQGAAPIDAAAGLQTFSVNELIGTRYRIVRFIARGGMGEVYEAWDTLLEEPIALKTIACTRLDNSRLLARLRAEVQLARRVTHYNVCRLLEFGLHQQVHRGQTESLPYFTMELLPGETLSAHRASHGRLGEAQAVMIVQQILDGLAAIHSAGIVHRDLKPDNVFVLPNPTGVPRVVVTDFGLARSLNRPQVGSNSVTIGGTPAYMAPEQALGSPASTAWDIYAIGIILFELLAGKLPFEGTTPMDQAMARLRHDAPRVWALNAQVTPALGKVVARCLQANPTDRYSNVHELRQALSQALRSSSPGRRRFRRGVVWLSLMLLALLLGYFHPTWLHW